MHSLVVEGDVRKVQHLEHKADVVVSGDNNQTRV